jgi:hypothetical protein
MNRMLQVPALTVAALLLLAPQAGALTSQQQRMKDCNAQAASKKGAERQEFMKTCLSGEAKAEQHETQQEKMKTCNAEASSKNLKGADRKKFMSTCLSAR